MTAPAEHGTYAGYHAHYRDGEQPCEACRAVGTERKTKNKRIRQERALAEHGCREAYKAGCRCNDCRSWRASLWSDADLRDAERNRAS